MRVIYFDCFSGASGDMLLGALLDMGASEEVVRREIKALDLDGWGLEVQDTIKGGLHAKQAVVKIGGPSPTRTLSDIMDILDQAPLLPEVKERALKTFGLLADAEATVHGGSLSQIHLHEAGDDDALIDVIGVSAAIEDLDPEAIGCSPLPMGSGVVESDHGPIPIPGPVVTEILRDVPVHGAGQGELVTPTGAALLKVSVDRFAEMPPMILRATGYGAGTRDLELPNVVRAMFGDLLAAPLGTKRVWVVETNLDDMAPELFPYVIDRLLEAGAQDAWIAPIAMKKGRPAFTLSVLCDAAERDRVLDVIYSETTTLGTRIRPAIKDELEREWTEVEVEGHVIRVKVAKRGSRVVNAAPEHDDAVQVARATGLPLKEIYQAVSRQLGTPLD